MQAQKSQQRSSMLEGRCWLRYLRFIFRAFIGLAPIIYVYILTNISLFCDFYNIYFIFLLSMTFL
ncbi:hypothetical protein AM1_0032 [Acaryochloris marina MBIC11017]|uniref:Uncharacterized protein n=1 Tax=Acaryochloris marina (strain MBIC 11017) TaxID=329726 RepID=B0C508_ACAM1|nr:hypothetical protein AM1_0032 [Acaryochloris marina MBIC11017]